MSLRAENITVKVGQKTLVENISLEAQPGEVLVIIGPNGAGKSTLIKALTGDVKLHSGEVRMDDRPLNQWSLRDRARMRAILAQTTSLNFAFTVLEVVLMGRGPHSNGVESVEDYTIAYQALAATEVEHLQDRLYTTLSGGERQRVQLARILAQIWTPLARNNRYLLMDEPTNNLDLNHQHSALRLARAFADDGVSVVAILHDINLAAQYADRILVIKEGRIIIHGTPRQVLTSETIQEAFGMPVMVTDHPFHDCPLVVTVNDPQLIQAETVLNGRFAASD